MKIIDSSGHHNCAPLRDESVCMMAKAPNESRSTLDAVLQAVAQERFRQDAKWGEQNHPDFYQVVDQNTGTVLGPMPLPQRFTYYGLPTEEDAKSDCESTFKKGKGNWGHIALEEFCESFGTTDQAKLEEELIQTTAVLVAWVQCIRRRKEATK